MKNHWFRMYHEFATDPKVQMLSEIDQRRYIMLLCLRCSNGDVTLHDNEVAFQLRIAEDDYQRTKSILIEKDLIKSDNTPTNWNKRQFASDSSAERVRVHREKKKRECNVTCNSEETKCNALDTDTETEDKVVTFPSATPTCPHGEIVGVYHEVLPELPKVVKLTDKRKKYLKARWAGSRDAQDLDWWRVFFQSVRDQPFLMGSNNRGWTADFEWLVTEGNFLKVLEGKYRERG